jgi:MFS family permease
VATQSAPVPGTDTAFDGADLTRENLRIGIAVMIGALIEWYDFLIYATASALVFPQVFFPNVSPTLGSVVAFSSFAVGYLFRPLGGIVMGHFGDRIGRKAMLVVTMVAMGLATTSIGMLPGYTTLGIWAPILLIGLRAVQGIALGGELGGAILMAVEHAPARRRGLFSSFPQLGSTTGLVVANLVFLAINLSMSAEDFLSFGWRVPFLLSAILVIVGIYVRLRISESPIFIAAQLQGRRVAIPIVTVLTKGRSPIIRIVMANLFPGSIGFITIVFMLSYGTQTLHLSRAMILSFIIIANFLEIPTSLCAGSLSDRFGRKKIILSGIAVGVVMSAIFFPLVNTAIPLVVFLCILAVRLAIATMFGATGAWMAELFDTSVRYTGVSVSAGISVLIGSQTPAIAALLVAASDGGTTWLSCYLFTASTIAFLAVLAMGETLHVDLRQQILK